MHFQKLQNRHKLCIFNITSFAYDFLFEQHKSSYDECLMDKSSSNQEAGMIIVHHLGQSNQDSENLSKAKQPGANLCLSHFGALQQRILPDQTSSGGMEKYFQQGQLPTFPEHGHSRKNTTHNQRPTRLTYLGKNKGFPANQKGSGKMKG